MFEIDKTVFTMLYVWLFFSPPDKYVSSQSYNKVYPTQCVQLEQLKQFDVLLNNAHVVT